MAFSDSERNFYREYTRQMGHLGTFNLETHEGREKIRVGHKFFDNPLDAITYKNNLNIKTFARITHGSKIHERPGMGPGYYGNLEGLLENMAELDPRLSGASIERMSYGVRQGVTRAVLDDLRDKNGKFTGFLHPAEKELKVLRIRTASGEYLDEEGVTTALSRVFNFTDDAGKYDKIYKRLNQLFNMEEYGDWTTDALRVKTFDPKALSSDLSSFFGTLSPGAAESGFDGQSFGNANVLKVHASKMEARANELLKAFAPGDNSPEAIAAKGRAAAIKQKAKELRSISKTGGRTEAFRALGLLNADDLAEIQGSVKGDIYWAPQKKFIKTLRELGIGSKVASRTDIFTSVDNIKEELSKIVGAGKNVSYLTTRPTHVQSTVRYDLQAALAQGSGLGRPEELARHTIAVYEGQINRLMTTGEIPHAYRRELEKMANAIEPEDGELMQRFLERKRYAQGLLARADSGMPPTPEFINEVLNGLKKSLPSIKQSSNFIMPAATGAHMGSGGIAKMGRYAADDIAEGEIRYFKGFGWAMTPETLSNIKHLTGGSDLDDLLRTHLRYIEEEDEFAVIGVRSPTTKGENIVLDINLRKDPADFVQLLSREDDRYRGQVDELLEQRKRAALPQRLSQSFWQAAEDLSRTQERMAVIRAGKAGRSAEVGAELDKLIRRQHTVSNRLRRIDASMAAAVAEAPAIGIGAIDEALRGIAKQIAPKATRQQLQQYAQYRTVINPKTGRPERRPMKSVVQADYESWLAGKPKNTAARLLGDVKIESEAAALMEEFAGMNVHNRRALARAFANETLSTMGGLGGVVNVDMLANSIIPQLEELNRQGVKGVKGILPFTDMEDLIDKLIQGSSDSGFTFEDIVRRKNAMIEGIAEAVALHDVKLPGTYMEDPKRGGHIRTPLKAAIERYNPTFFEGGKTLDAAYGSTYYEELGEAWDGTQLDVEELADRARRLGYDRSAIQRYSFSLAESDEANRMFKVFTAATDHYRFLRDTNLTPMSEMADLAENMYATDTVQRRAAAALQNELSRYMDDGVLSDHGVKVFGAMLQQNRRRLAGVLGSGSLGGVTQYAETYFDRAVGSGINYTPEQILKQDEVLRAGITVDDISVSTLDDDLQRTIDAIRNQPGYVRGARNEAAFGQAAETAGQGGKKIFENFQWDQVRKLMDDAPMLKRGLVGAAGLVGFSAIYSKLRDRSPEDMQGPPLLPGGSAYEDLPQQAMQPSPLAPVPAQEGGVTYKVIADGSYDPGGLQSSIGDIMGSAPIVGSFYNTQPGRIPRPRYNRRDERTEIFGEV